MALILHEYNALRNGTTQIPTTNIYIYIYMPVSPDKATRLVTDGLTLYGAIPKLMCGGNNKKHIDI